MSRATGVFGAPGHVFCVVEVHHDDSVRQFAERLGFATIDAGGLVNARLLEPLGMLNITLGYALGWGTGIAPTWLRRG